MQIQRVGSILQGVADVRNWVIQHIPLATSLVGYDLFLKVGNNFASGRPLELDVVFKELPHSEADIREQIAAMVLAGLVTTPGGADGSAISVVPTQRYIELLKQYQTQFERQFIPRRDLRKRQLLADAPDERLQGLVETLYDHFHDIGWIYLHNFGGVCFLISSLVRRAALAHGFQARLESCHVKIRKPPHEFSLGSPGFAAPGQIEGHAVCIIDDAILVDFGLGNVRRGYRRDFYWGLASAYEPHDEVMAQIVLPQGDTVTWQNDWQTPDGPAEFAKYEPLVEQLFAHYVDRFG